MKINYYKVDTFISDLFSGNPAGVCLLKNLLPDEMLTAIARKNNLPVTVFLHPENATYGIRWFTSDGELTLCGHGTLAAAAVIFDQLGFHENIIEVNFPKTGNLTLSKKGDFFEISLPAKIPKPCTSPKNLFKGLGISAKEVYEYKKERILIVLEDEEILKNLIPNFEWLSPIEHRAVVITAPSKTIDFVSRTFYPEKTTPEDAVTGASHCLLVPFWSKKLGKTALHAYQLSERGGEIFCVYTGNQVFLSGRVNIHAEENL